ncbi:DUF2334 domain-containing protein [Tropicimonas sediminicola]|uniref:Peptidoglycan/xylan/chitin deacetylase, PgdA/CDA1 family n=1 Tax=Tropicimonas sediminicola TaxID=1031541 RepID=A0A239F1A8_9RHOB|nr:DUF2334 domain-containing protein [Tropicimonas sediminicola]SNS50491.1 Peptidoglycan/xylan/chitin deacetylase, PgdA/CDA1 family [Tropicimonas sediminicola]
MRTLPELEQRLTELPRIILKLDDAGAESDVAPACWRETMDVLNEQRVVASLGVIGRGLEMPGEAFLDWLTDQSATGHEIWNHGYAHDRPEDAQPLDGQQGAEFRGTSFGHQLAALRRTQELARRRLGLTLATFGAPFNATDQATVSAMHSVEELEVWLFKETPFPTSKRVLHRIPEVNIEYPVHVPDYEAFRRGFDRHLDKQVLVLQGHPNSWFGDRSRFAAFTRIVRFLVDQKAVFLTPREWATGLSPSTSEG